MTLALELVALVLSVVVLMQSRAQNLLAWAVLALALAFTLPVLR